MVGARRWGITSSNAAIKDIEQSGSRSSYELSKSTLKEYLLQQSSPAQSVPPTGNQVFKYTSLWGIFLFQAPHTDFYLGFLFSCLSCGLIHSMHLVQQSSLSFFNVHCCFFACIHVCGRMSLKMCKQLWKALVFFLSMTDEIVEDGCQESSILILVLLTHCQMTQDTAICLSVGFHHPHLIATFHLWEYTG